MRDFTTNPRCRQVGVWAVVLLSVLSTMRFVLASKHADLKIDATQYEHRFDHVRLLLPNHGVIGYLGENPGADLPAYYLTQYELAPLIVEHSDAPDLVIGDFRSSSANARADWPKQLVPIQSFANGVVLLARKDRSADPRGR